MLLLSPQGGGGAYVFNWTPLGGKQTNTMASCPPPPPSGTPSLT